MFDIVTMGSATIDTFARSKSKLIKIYDQKGESDLLAFSIGSKVLIDDLHYSCGGGGTNTAAAFARLGTKVAFLGILGKGHNSELVLSILKKHGIDTSLVVRGEGHTGASIILDNIENDRVILTHKGINDHLLIKDIPRFDTQWIYSSSLTGESFNTLAVVAKSAKKRGIRFAFNPSEYQVEQGMENLRPVLRNVDVLILNKTEAKTLTRHEDLKAMFRSIHHEGPSIVAITDGKDGVYVSEGETAFIAPAKPVEVVDATGAGDAFAATFVACLMKKLPISKAMVYGIENSSSVIRKVGAKEGLLTWKQILSRKKVSVKKMDL